MKKIEIIVTRLYIEKVIAILEKEKVSNYYILDISDFKTPGEERMAYGGIVPAQDKSRVSTYLEDEAAQKLLSSFKKVKKELDLSIFTIKVEEIE